jgi:hypothetical protein
MVTYCGRWLNGGAAATTMLVVLEGSRASHEFQKNERAETGASGKNKRIAHAYCT